MNIGYKVAKAIANFINKNREAGYQPRQQIASRPPRPQPAHFTRNPNTKKRK